MDRRAQNRWFRDTLFAVFILTRQELTAAGYSWAAVRANVDARRWQALNEKVICTHTGRLSFDEACTAVFLSAPQPAALCGLTALQLWGVRGFPDESVHLLVSRGATPSSVARVPVAVHESRRFSAGDVLLRGRVGLTSIERAVIDAAAWSTTVITAARIVVAAVQQRRTWPDRLLPALAAAGRVRHARTLRLLLQDLDGGAEALSEVEFLRFCRRHHLPRPRLQVRASAGGRRRYLDAVFQRRDGRAVHVEVDGGVHLTLATRWHDTRKDNWAAIDGRLVLRFPSVALYADDPEAVAQLRRALEWSGPDQARAWSRPDKSWEGARHARDG